MRSITPSSISMRSMRLRGRRIAVAQAHAVEHARAQVLALGAAVGRLEARDQLLAQLELDRAALGDLEGAGDRLGPLGEGGVHFLAVAQVELVRFEGQLGLQRSCSWSARTAGRCGARSPRGAGSARRPCPPGCRRPRARSARCPRCTSPAPPGRSSAPRSTRSPSRRPSADRRRARGRRPHGPRAGAGRSARPGSR